MKAIILAAGKGSRLETYAQNMPKCLVSIGTKKLLDYQLQSLASMGITDITMVVGYKKEKIEQHIEQYPNLNFTLLENSDYAVTNTAYSLWLSKETLTDDFVFMNADVLFHPEVLRRIMQSPQNNVLAVERKPVGQEEVKVILDGSRIKSIGKDIPIADSYGEFIGVGRCSKKTATLFSQALDQVVACNDGKKAYFEAALQLIISSAYINAVDVTDVPCIEIDFPEDLFEARTHIINEFSNGSQKKTTRVLFYAERNLHLPFLEPIHDYMAAYYDVQLAFAAPPYQQPRSGATGYGLDSPTTERLKAKSAFYEHPDEFQPDIIVVADTCFYPIRNKCRIVNVGHGLISKGWFYTDSPVVRRENIADLICVPGVWHKQILQKNIFVPIHVTGFIKSDALFRCGTYEISSFFRKHAIPENVKIVLFAPTFNDELSAVPCVKERICELIEEKTVVLIKLHNMTDPKWVNIYERLAKQEKNIFLIDDNDFTAAMTCADVMISDVSSAYVEFMLLDKPVVLFNNPMQRNYDQHDENNIEYKVRDAGIQVGSIEELKLAVKLSLADPDEYSQKRQSYAELINCKIDGKCAQRAARAIMQLATDDESRITDDVFFSIIMHCGQALSKEELHATLHEIQQKSAGLKYEIILTGHISTQWDIQNRNVRLCENNYLNQENKFDRALAEARGDFFVFLQPGTALPRLWLKWLYHYFKWHPDAGAVKALSQRDDYNRILEKAPPSQRPETLHDISEYFVHVLMGNEVMAATVDNDTECIMIAKDAYQKLFVSGKEKLSGSTLEEMCAKMRDYGFTVWHALEVFVYPLHNQPASTPDKVAGTGMDIFTKPAPVDACLHKTGNTPGQETTRRKNENIERLLQEALDYKKGKKYADAITRLESAKKSIEDCNAEEQGNIKHIEALLEESRMHKKKKDYMASIQLLEEAKQKIA